MQFDNYELAKLVQELALSDDIQLSDIPELDLYMEQLTSFMDTKLSGFKRDASDKILTKTMINNYTKAGLVMPPKNKKYSKDHIILLLLIYQLKSVLSINDIGALFGPILNNLATREDDLISLDEIYATFLELKHLELDDFRQNFLERSNIIKTKTENIDAEHKDLAELFLIVLTLVAQANVQKRLAEKIIDHYLKKHPAQ